MKSWVLCVAIAACLTACATTTSSTGRTQYVGGMSQQQLDQLGAQAFTEAKNKGPLSNDAKQNAYVRCVVNALVRQLPAAQQQVGWETAVFAENEPNAFALPGGKVGVNTGIFSVAKNQDQLAAVIAHEIGHVVEQHRLAGRAGRQPLRAKRFGTGDPGRQFAGTDRLPAAGDARPGKRGRYRRPAADGAGRFRPAAGCRSLAEHDAGQRRQPTPAVAVDSPGSQQPYP
jgi:hypothetical protein